MHEQVFYQKRDEILSTEKFAWFTELRAKSELQREKMRQQAAFTRKNRLALKVQTKPATRNKQEAQTSSRLQELIASTHNTSLPSPLRSTIYLRKPSIENKSDDGSSLHSKQDKQ